MRRARFLILFPFFLSVLSSGLNAQNADIDISACEGMYKVLVAMKGGASKETVSRILTPLLETRPYALMFRHYNRSWRPNELPPAVFSRMILSLRFENEYRSGENVRADIMRARWETYYNDLTLFEHEIKQVKSASFVMLVNSGVRYAQGWLPAEWKIPNFYLAVIPNGGSPAFAFEGAQGYDFLQLGQKHPGTIDWNWLLGTVAHESHHLGIRIVQPSELPPSQLRAFQVVTMCIAEGAATYFVSGPPSGNAPAFRARFHVFTPELAQLWREGVGQETDMVQRQADMLDRAANGKLSQDEYDEDLRKYWYGGTLGKSYVLGSEMFGAIYTAYGKQGVFSAMRDPRRLFDLYNKSLKAKPKLLKNCIPMPEKAVRQALDLGEPNSKANDDAK